MDRHTNSPAQRKRRRSFLFVMTLCITLSVLSLACLLILLFPTVIPGYPPEAPPKETRSADSIPTFRHYEEVRIPLDSAGRLKQRPLFHPSEYGEALTTIFAFSFDGYAFRDTVQWIDNTNLLTMMGAPDEAWFIFKDSSRTLFKTCTENSSFVIKIYAVDPIPAMDLVPIY